MFEEERVKSRGKAGVKLGNTREGLKIKQAIMPLDPDLRSDVEGDWFVEQGQGQGEKREPVTCPLRGGKTSDLRGGLKRVSLSCLKHFHFPIINPLQIIQPLLQGY